MTYRNVVHPFDPCNHTARRTLHPVKKLYSFTVIENTVGTTELKVENNVEGKT